MKHSLVLDMSILYFPCLANYALLIYFLSRFIINLIYHSHYVHKDEFTCSVSRYYYHGTIAFCTYGDTRLGTSQSFRFPNIGWQACICWKLWIDWWGSNHCVILDWYRIHVNLILFITIDMVNLIRIKFPLFHVRLVACVVSRCCTKLVFFEIIIMRWFSLS